MSYVQKDGQFVFRKNDDIGATAAEDDSQFLKECFVDIGDLQTLLSCEEAKRIIVGRTGAGKTALLATISNTQTNVVQLSPHSLSLNYIANNGVINFFEKAGVNLTPFYMLLWKHVFIVELLKAKYTIKNEEGQRQIMSRLHEKFTKKDRTKEAAIDYLESWGNKFWITVDERLRELTERITKSLSGSIATDAIVTKLRGEGALSLTNEERTEVVQRGQKAVSEVQIRELERVIDVLGDDIFSDPQDHYYLTVDELDEEWADDRIKYKLIKALIDTVRSFRRVRNVKILVALRLDLLQKVVHSTPDTGFQEEKYESLYVYLQWTRKQLTDLLERRLNFLIRRRYTQQPIPLSELLPSKIDNEQSLDYIFDRTLMRPRDVIMFLNECIAHAEGRPVLTAQIIKQAEEQYSLSRLQSIAQEWKLIYPYLRPVALIFRGFKSAFSLSDISQDLIASRFTEMLDEGNVPKEIPKNDPNIISLESLYSTGNFNTVRNTLIRNLHQVGILGIKAGPTTTFNWATDSRRAWAPLEVRGNATIAVHPMFYRALEIRL